MLATPPNTVPYSVRNRLYFQEDPVALKREIDPSPVMQTLLKVIEYSAISLLMVVYF